MRLFHVPVACGAGPSGLIFLPVGASHSTFEVPVVIKGFLLVGLRVDAQELLFLLLTSVFAQTPLQAGLLAGGLVVVVPALVVLLVVSVVVAQMVLGIVASCMLVPSPVLIAVQLTEVVMAVETSMMGPMEMIFLKGSL